MERRNGHIYEFTDFQLIPGEGLLLRQGEPVSLAPKAFSTLVLLVERQGHLVEKAELIDRVWENAFVEEAVVSRCVWAIRNALGEDPKKHEFIQTVPKRGYRFVAEVAVIDSEANSINGHPSGTSEVRSVQNGNGSLVANGADDSKASVITVVGLPEEHGRKNGYKAELPFPSAPPNEFSLQAAEPIVDRLTSRFQAVLGTRSFFMLAGLAAVLFGLAAVYFFSTGRTEQGAENRSRIAVLPLKPIDVEKRDPICEFAIAESLILKLSTHENLTVRPLNAVRRYVELDRDPIDAGLELDADFVLSSNYQLLNGRIRVTSQLLNIRTGQTADTFKSESDASNAFSMQDAIANEIGNAVLTRFGAAPDSFTVRRGTANEEAYRLYLQGMYLTEKYNRKDAARAIETFDEALKLDPTYAAAWAGKAHAHCTFAHRGGNAPIVEFANAEPALDRALAIDNKNADAYGVRGIINRDYHWNFAEAYKNLDRALELDPNHLFAHRVRSGLLTRDGRHDEAMIEQKKAIDLNPGAIGEHWLYADALIQARRYDDAIHQANRVREMDNSFAAAYYILWVSYHFKDDNLRAYENFLQNKRFSGSSVSDIAKIEAAFRDSGWLGVLRADRDARIASLESDYSPAKYYIAGLSAVLGDNEQALKYLNECLENRLIGLSSIKVDPFLDSLRGDPQFEEIVRKAGL